VTTDDDWMNDFFRHAEEDMLPKMKESALSIAIFGKPDAKLCMEIGAAVLFDKPIIVVAAPDMVIPANLKRVASAIVIGSPSDPATGQQLRDALTAVMENDARTKQ
jgi:hypothetical protein